MDFKYRKKLNFRDREVHVCHVLRHPYLSSLFAYIPIPLSFHEHNRKYFISNAKRLHVCRPGHNIIVLKSPVSSSCCSSCQRVCGADSDCVTLQNVWSVCLYVYVGAPAAVSIVKITLQYVYIEGTQNASSFDFSFVSFQKGTNRFRFHNVGNSQ